MKEVIVYCEGPTEETFVNKVLKRTFEPLEVYMKPSSCGGVSKYSKIRRDLNELCKHYPKKIVTTMLDFYGLPSDTPGIRDNVMGTVYDKVAHVERSISRDLNVPNLIPNLLVHEFEALLFSKPECFSYCSLSQKQLRELVEIREEFETPEDINNSYETAPSRRIKKIHPQYVKPIDGVNIAIDIGLATMCDECTHFSNWIQKLRTLGK